VLHARRCLLPLVQLVAQEWFVCLATTMATDRGEC
jgi:hypothetical protein